MPALNNALSAVALTVAALSPSLHAQSTSWVRDSAPGAPAARSGHALCTDTLLQDVVLFGGQGVTLLGDTWRLHAGAWQQVAVGAGPTARAGHAMAYDAAHQRVVLFGGDDGAPTGDTWSWDGTSWTELAIAGPSPRAGHAMAYDAARQRVVLFGGSAAPGTALADTWEFDGFGWTQAVTAGGPVARDGHAMVFAGGQVLLYGGRSPAIGPVADSWRWSGTLWQPVLTAHFPPARREHAMARDGAGRVVLFGGLDTVQRADTWRFDGVDWTQLAPVGAPPSPRSEAALADGVLAGPLLFGGENGGLLRDSWSLFDAAMPYGQGCGSPALGFVPDPTAPPLLGQLAGATITNAPTVAAGVMMGWSRDLFGPFPLPLSLDGFGMTGCELLQSAEIVGLGASVLTPTSLSFQFPIPNAPHLIGVEVFVQAYGYAPGANPAQLIVSNAIDWALAAPLAGQFSIVEPFDTADQFDAAASGGLWFGGTGTFGRIGGDGRHGAFDLALATATGTQIDGRDLYVIDCDHTVIPADRTIDGLEAVVTDGRFFFSTMTVPADAHVRFVGSSPAVLNVVGRLSVAGVLDVGGESQVATPASTQATGQPGAAGGAFGGRGGAGGNRCLGTGAQPSYSGQDGEDGRLPAGHAYAFSTVGTGGKGSALFPASGLNADMLFALNPVPTTPLSYALSTVAGGGGGGGGWTAGHPGAVDAVLQGGAPLPNQASFMGPMTAASSQAALFPLPAGAKSSLHFLISGAGGGGAASNSTLAINLARQWAPGSGGGGGGGAMALRAGTQLLLDASGALLANGGSAANRVGPAAGPQPAPGGGGAGGSIVLQCDGATSLPGLIDVRGGDGGLLSVIGGGGLPPGGGQVDAHGGDGGDGFVHFERTFQPSLFDLPNVLPSVSTQHLGPLVELDPLVAMQSTWYATGSDRPVDYRRYELVANVSGVITTFSDDPAVAPMAATVGAPVRARFQAARLDLVTGEVLEVGPWREFVGNRPGHIGIAAEGFNAFRFQLVLDRAVATQVAIDEVRVVYGQ
ncbi:MAG: kelch repeat-containing protein [Planctomycetota bacterium]